MKDLIAFIWARVVCFVSGHVWGKTVRDTNLTPQSGHWMRCVIKAPVTGDIIHVMRREFDAHRFCDRCQKLEQLKGYDTKPTLDDPFENARKTKENSPTNVIPLEQARKMFPNFDAQSKP